MKERGFMPFSAAGALIVIIVLGIAVQAACSRHQRSISTIDDISSSSLLAIAAGIHGDLQSAVKYAVYRALWEISKNANRYDESERKRTVESLATRYFKERVEELGPEYALHDARIEFDILDENPWPAINLIEAENGYVLARASLPEDSRIKLVSRDRSLSIAMPFENIDVFVDSRYFLLQQCMRDFVERFGDINSSWGIMEYAQAWVEAWLSGKVELSDCRTKAFFDTAWAAHEFDTFGSFDYYAAAKGLINDEDETSGGLLSEPNDRKIVANPIRATDLKGISNYIDGAIGSIDDASILLEKASICVGLAIENLKKHQTNNLEKIESIRGLLEKTTSDVATARGKVLEVEAQMNHLLEFMASYNPSDVAMMSLYQSFTSRLFDKDFPCMKEQVELGVRGTSTKLLELEQKLTSFFTQFDTSGTEDPQRKLVLIKSSIEEMFSEPNPKRWVKFKTYVDNPPRPIEEMIPVYIDDEKDGTIALLDLILDGFKNNIDELINFSQQIELEPERLQTFEISDYLTEKIKTVPPKINIDREDFYELLPPVPIMPSPGLSVYHELEVKSVNYRREDLAGLLGSPTATPVPLLFIGVTLWWGQWNITVELEDIPVEEIFDFDNPTLPLAHGQCYVHKPLAYRWEMPEKTFETTVVVISLQPFTISTR